jgi:hypothetical protein
MRGYPVLLRDLLLALAAAAALLAADTPSPVQCRLTLQKAEIAETEPIDFAVEIKNVTDKPLEFRISWDPGSLHVLTKDGKEVPYAGPMYTHPSVPVSLKPGEVYTWRHKEWPVNYHLTPGEYQVFFFETEGGPNDATVILRTAPVGLTVVPRRPAG